jgi:formate hydrogenlyase transcriptional activator
MTLQTRTRIPLTASVHEDERAALAADDLAALLRITQSLSAPRNRESLFETLAESIVDVVPADRFVVQVGASQEASLIVYDVSEAAQVFEGKPALGESLLEEVMGSRDMMIVSRPEELQESFLSTYSMFVENDMHSIVALPLLSGEECLGALAFLAHDPLAWDGRRVSMLREIASAVSVTLGNCLRNEALQRSTFEFEALLSLNRAIGRHLERDELFGALAGGLRHLFKTDRFGIELPIAGGKLQGHLLSPTGARQEATQPSVLPAEGTACSWVMENREWIVVASREELRERFPVTFDVMQAGSMQSLCALPLVTGGRARAALFFMAGTVGAYQNLSRALLDQVASAIAVALDDCLAHEEVERLRDRLAAENTYLQEEIRQDHNFGELVGKSPALLEVLADAQRFAPTDSTVLILGETGTGKEIIARAIHERSSRRERPLVKVNCGAINAGLVESELFGHVKGAFTGAHANRDGRFKLADGGTIFLDEVGELPSDTQVKLLRVLQEREFEPVGSSKSLHVDVRVIAATNRDLEQAVREMKFRADLFYRLNVLPLRVPPLRERRDDIRLLASFFACRLARRLGRPEPRIPESVMRQLMDYAWPGNVRELQNVIERAVVLTGGDSLELYGAMLPPAAGEMQRVPQMSRPPSTHGESEPLQNAPPKARVPFEDSLGRTALGESLEDVERRHIENVLRRTGWIIEGRSGAASLLRLQPSTLRSRMKKLGIERPSA